jgi:hypothetical protein
MRTILALAFTAVLVAPGAIADDDAVDVVRAKQARERAEASTVPVLVTKVYVVQDLLSLYKGDTKRASEQVAELLRRSVPALRGGSIAAFPTNLSVVVSATDVGHKELADYLTRLSSAKTLIEAAGLEIVETD